MLPLGLMFVFGAWLVIGAGGPQQLLADGVRRMGEVVRWLGSLGVFGPVVFLLCYVALLSTVWVAAWICSIIGGILFGFWPGMTYSMVGATLGATSVFLMARLGLGGLVQRAGPG